MPSTLCAKRLAALEAVQAAPPEPPVYLTPLELAERAGIHPDEWQADVLTSPAPRLLLNCSRQSGKSTVTALLALHTALYQPPALVLVLSPTERQSAELLRKVTSAYAALGAPVPADGESLLRLELTNGSRIVALPGREATVRAYSGVGLLILDEAARIDDQLYFATRPMLAVSGGRLILLSTPNGRRGVFHREWMDGQGWQRVEIPATRCPRITRAFLAEEAAALPPWVYEQEYGCQFRELEGSVFRYGDIEAALSDTVHPLFALGGARPCS